MTDDEVVATDVHPSVLVLTAHPDLSSTFFLVMVHDNIFVVIQITGSVASLNFGIHLGPVFAKFLYQIIRVAYVGSTKKKGLKRCNSIAVQTSIF